MRSWNFPGISKFRLPVRIDAIVAVVIMTLPIRTCKLNTLRPAIGMSLEIKNGLAPDVAARIVTGSVAVQMLRCVRLPGVQTRTRPSSFARPIRTVRFAHRIANAKA